MNGTLALTRLDWRRAQIGAPAECVFCDTMAVLRHPVTRRPCHKLCSDRRRLQLIEQAAASAAGGRAPLPPEGNA